MKGRQIALTLYLPPQKYWLLKSISRRENRSMQDLLRGALDQVLAERAFPGAPDNGRNGPHLFGRALRRTSS